MSSPVVLSVTGAVPTGGDNSPEMAHDTEHQLAFITNSVSNIMSILDASDSTNPTVMALTLHKQ